MIPCFRDIFKSIGEDVQNTERWYFLKYSDMSPGRLFGVA